MPIVVRDAKRSLIWVATKEYRYDLPKRPTSHQLRWAFSDIHGLSRDPNIQKINLILETGVEPEQSRFAEMAKSFGLTWRIDG